MKMDQQICRVCLDSNNRYVMQSIFEFDGENIEISQKISECAGIKIVKNDNRPEHICAKCYNNLILSFQFRKLCQITEEKLRLKFEEQNLEDYLNNKIKLEVIGTVDYTEKLEPHYIEKKEFLYEIEGLENNFDDEYNDIVEKKQKTKKKIVESSTELQNPSNDDVEKSDNIEKDFLYEIRGLENNADDEYNDIVEENNTTKQKTKKKIVKSFTELQNSSNDAVKNEKIPQLVVRRKLKDQKEKLFICEICGNFYNKKYQLRRHREIHTDVLNFECEICHKKFRQNNYLARHMRSHTGQKPHECKYCNRCFSDLSTKIKHERLHTGERPFKCETCEKSFTYSDVLKKHMLVHTGEKPFSCDLCGSSFARKHHLTTHFKSLMHLSKLK